MKVKDLTEALGFCAIVGVSAFIDLIAYDWLRFNGIIAVIAGLVVTVACIIIGTKFYPTTR